MSERSTVERAAAAPLRNAATSIDNLTFLLGVGAVVAAVVGGSCSTNARIGDLRAEVGTLRAEFGGEIRDLRAEIRDVRARVESLGDSTAASFATVQRQLAAVAACILELRNLVGGGDGAGRDRASTACDSALQAILASAAPAGL